MIYELHNVTVKQDKNRVPVLKNLTISIEEKTPVIIAGPPGSGKTSLIRLLYFDLLPSIGELLYNGKSIRRFTRSELIGLRKDFGIIDSTPLFVPSLTIAQNIGISLTVKGVAASEADVKTSEMIAGLGISHIRDVYPGSVSSCEAKLAAIGRALIHEPSIILADDPFSSFDEQTTFMVMEMLRNAWRSGASLIIASNNSFLQGFFPGSTLVNLSEGKIVSNENPVTKNVYNDFIK